MKEGARTRFPKSEQLQLAEMRFEKGQVARERQRRGNGARQEEGKASGRMLTIKPKTIVTAILLLFVAASVAYLVVKEMGARSQPPPAQSASTPSLTVQEQSTSPAAPPVNTATTARVVAYYFHGNVRCMKCRTIEAYAKEAIASGFPDALRDGRLEWRVVNVEEPGNDRYIQEFQLSTRSVVLERLTGGKRREWKNLERVWEFVRGDKEDFLKYVQDETRAYLEAAGK